MYQRLLCNLPTGLLRTRNQTVQTKVPKTDSANLELAVNASGTPTKLTASLDTRAELWRTVGFFDLSFTCHLTSSYLCFDYRFDSGLLNGIPNAVSNARPESLSFAEVTNAMFMPCGWFTVSGSTSGNTNCS